jgi:DNA-binding LytR/AlgR family response regulator
MKAVIIEDELLVARQLERRIANLETGIEIVALLPSLKTARKWFMENAQPDLLFMDIQLSDGISFDLFNYYQLSCPVIFTTAYDEYAIRAFKVNGIDYLLKPVDDEDLVKAIEKSRQYHQRDGQLPRDMNQLMQILTNPSQHQQLYKQKFIISVRHQWIPVDTKDIAYFVRDGLNYLHTFQGEKYILDYESMDDIESLLDPRQFYRANRQYIVNIQAIQTIVLHENQKLTLNLKPPLKATIDISREKAPQFKKWFDR